MSTNPMPKWSSATGFRRGSESLMRLFPYAATNGRCLCQFRPHLCWSFASCSLNRPLPISRLFRPLSHPVSFPWACFGTFQAHWMSSCTSWEYYGFLSQFTSVATVAFQLSSLSSTRPFWALHYLFRTKFYSENPFLVGWSRRFLHWVTFKTVYF